MLFVVTKTKNQPDLQFQISQLRIDKIIFAIDALLVCFTVFLLLVSLPLLYSYVPTLPQYTPAVLVGVAVASSLFALGGNVLRWRKIRSLESELNA